jgi:predicted nucleic acid-binding Zn finger protein
VNQQQQLDRSNGKAESLVISRTEEGFRVYAPADPTKSYIVGGGPDEPNCTCPDFQYHQGSPGAYCRHIQAVLAQTSAATTTDNYDQEERRALQNEDLPEPERKNGGAQMLLKRSVSPDGRIDSLSVEFSCPVDQASAGQIKATAHRTLQLQAEIVQGFLAANGKENGRRPEPAAYPAPYGNGALPGQMLAIGGINTKWGRRLYIAVQSNGDTLKFFGSRKQLAEALASAGYPQLGERIEEGQQLNVACRIVTKRSEDGRYVNVEQVLPANCGVSRRWA